MDTQELSHALNLNPTTQKHFQGVYAYDQLPRRKHAPNGYYIANLDPLDQPGSHWIAMKKSSSGKNLFFDSYGYAPQKYRFKSFLKNYEYNQRRLQHPLATTCGQWCLYFIYCSCQGKTMSQMFRHFDSLASNDYTMNEIVNSIFNTNQPVQDTTFVIKQTVKNEDEALQTCPYYNCRKYH